MKNRKLSKLVNQVNHCRNASGGRVIFDKKTKSLAIEAIKSGCSFKEICENCSVSASTVNRWFKLAKRGSSLESLEIKIQRKTRQSKVLHLHHTSGWHIQFTDNDDVIEFIKKLNFDAVS